MRIVFIGTVEFSFNTLQHLINGGAEVVGVCTRAASDFNADYRDLTPLCEQHGIPYKHVRDINHPNNVQFIRELKPDVIYCFGWSSLLKEDILRIAPLGVIGFHPAALPYNKGRHPLIWALVLGLQQTASTFFFMDEGADTGDILSQEPISISSEDTAGTLYEKMTEIALRQIAEFTISLANNTYKRIQQPTNTGNSWRKRGIADGKIDFRLHSSTICNLVRALTTPYVGAHIDTPNGEVKVWKASEEQVDQNNIEPGKVIGLDGEKIQVKTANSSVWLIRHSFGTADMPKIGDYL
ncbi:formyltransferase family protein [Chitinophaga deserti]|uniref:formyltransferase family protein n=1 Tax=Chitinophaga deserti TaxID=2164099 RepID=UPI000D6AC206|nr:formyltransferase family protein [Chitinophaga deserti]